MMANTDLVLTAEGPPTGSHPRRPPGELQSSPRPVRRGRPRHWPDLVGCDLPDAVGPGAACLTRDSTSLTLPAVAPSGLGGVRVAPGRASCVRPTCSLGIQEHRLTSATC